jgi:RimJ/RimL family protein N-acetyltransferase
MQRIVLRNWRESDLPSYACMNADPEVMRYFPRELTREESAASLSRLRALIDQRGWGLWVVEVDDEFAGFTGLAIPGFEAPFMPAVEIGWRLRREFWGRNIAFEAAKQAMQYGFGTLNLAELVSFTAIENLRSRRLMERLGFVHEAGNDFEHPAIPEGHRVRPHVFYRKRNPCCAVGEGVKPSTLVEH